MSALLHNSIILPNKSHGRENSTPAASITILRDIRKRRVDPSLHQTTNSSISAGVLHWWSPFTHTDPTKNFGRMEPLSPSNLVLVGISHRWTPSPFPPHTITNVKAHEFSPTLSSTSKEHVFISRGHKVNVRKACPSYTTV